MCAHPSSSSAPCLSLEELFPSEVLTQIVASLSYRDMVSCLQLNQTFYSTLTRNRKRLSKGRITTMTIERKGDTINLSIAKNSFKSPKKEWLCCLSSQQNTAKRVKCEPEPSIADFYDRKGLSGLKWDAANKFTEFEVLSVEEALETHVMFICGKVDMMCLKLLNLSESDVRSLSRTLQLTGAGINHLQLVCDCPFTTPFIELVESSKAQTMDLKVADGALVDKSVFASNVVQNMWSLTLVCDDKTTAEYQLFDKEVTSLSADSIEIIGATQLTTAGIRTILQEWLALKRKIANITIGLKEENVDWNTVFDGFVCVSEEGAQPQDLVQPRRFKRSDGAILNVKWTENEVKMYLDEEDDEGEDYTEDEDE